MSKNEPALVLVRGGGDLATGVALRLHRAGVKLVITELAQPLAVRRAVSFAEAVYAGRHTVEEVTACLVKPEQLSAALEADEIPILIDPDADILSLFKFLVVIDGRLTKHTPSPLSVKPALHIGLGPGFHAGRDCQAVIETRRGHTLGRVYWTGTTQPDSGLPEGDPRRVLRAPSDGVLIAKGKIGDHVEKGQVIAVIQHDAILPEGRRDGVGEATLVPRSGQEPAGARRPGAHLPRAQVPGSAGENLQRDMGDSSPTAQSDITIISPFAGVLRGIIRDGIKVIKGLKIGDVDPRDDPSTCFLVSDKALAIGGGVLEAILSKEEIRKKLLSH